MIDIIKQREDNQEKSRVGKQQLLQKMREKEKTLKQITPERVAKKKEVPKKVNEQPIRQKELKDAYVEIQKLRRENAQLRRKNKALRQEKQHQKEEVKIQQNKWELSFKERVAKKEQELEEREQNLVGREAYAQKLVDLGWDEESTPLYELQKRGQYIETLIRLMWRINQKAYQVNQTKRQYADNVNRWKQRIDVLERRVERLENQKQRFKDELVMSDRRFIQLQNRYRQVNQSYFYGNSVDEILNQLIKHLSSKTMKQYSNLSVLNERYQQIFKDVNEIEESLYYGFIDKDEMGDGWLFYDMNHQVQLKLIYRWQFNEEKLDPGMVAKIERLEDDTALLLEIYPERVRRRKPKNKKVAKKRAPVATIEKGNHLAVSENNPAVSQWLSELVITIIGNRYLDSFIQAIKRVVKKVKVIDAYEKSPQQVNTAIKHSDYIFIDIGSVPHSVTNSSKQLEDELGQIQLFYQPKDNDGVARLRYLYWRLHPITVQKKSHS